MLNNTIVCQNCGGILRRLNSSCSNCGVLVTKHSSTGILHIEDAPNTVTFAQDHSLLTEKMIAAMQLKSNRAGNSAEPALTGVSQQDPSTKTKEPVAQVADFFAAVPPWAIDRANNSQDNSPVLHVIKQEETELRVPENNGVQQLMARLIESQISPSVEKRSDETLAENEVSSSRNGMQKRNRSKQSNSSENIQSAFKSAVRPNILIPLVVLAIASFFLLPRSEDNRFSLPSAHVYSSIGNPYTYSFQNKNGELTQGQFYLQQSGNSIKGIGRDFFGSAGYRNFQLEGTYNPPQLKLLKRYKSLSGLAVGPAINYEGEVKFSLSKKIFINGFWYLQAPFPAKLKWQARPDSSKIWWTDTPLELQENNMFLSWFWNEQEPVQFRFLKILALCILFGIGLMQVSVKFFGMNGLLNTWERQKYVPQNLVHQHYKLIKELGRAKAKGALLLGDRLDWKLCQFYRPRRLHLPSSMRMRSPHFLALGAGGKGKTRLLASMIVNDILSSDRSVVVVDSEGALVELVLRWLSSNSNAGKFIPRVSVIDPCRSSCELAFNPLLVNNIDSFQTVASSIVMAFKSIYTESQNQQNQWTQQTANILRNAVLLLMLNDKTLAELPTLLSDNDFRDLLLQNVETSRGSEWKTLIDAWANYKRLARSEQWLNWIEPILNRVQPLLSDPRISRLLTSRDHCLNLDSVLEEKRILLVRVPEGQLEKGGNLLGSLIVTGLRQVALTRFEKTGDEGEACSIYMDEMSNFIDGEAFDAICSDARKISFGIHGTMKSLQDVHEDYRNKLLINVGTMALFSLAKKDADQLGSSVFRVDGRKIKKINLRDVLNPVNSSPSMDLASDEEKLNINRLTGQDERTYFCHLVGTEAGVFRLRAPEFKDITRADVNWDLMESIYENREDEED